MDGILRGEAKVAGIGDIRPAEGYAEVESSGSEGGTIMADKSPKKSSAKTAPSKSLKEKRAEKRDKASKRKDD